MKCKFCGEEMPDNGRFCPYCGMDNSVEVVIDEHVVENTPQPTQPAQTPAEETAVPDVKKAKRMAAISGCIAVMAVLALVLFWGIKGFGDSGGSWDVKGWFDWEIFRENNVYKQDSYTVSDSKAEKKADVVVATLGEAELTNGQLQVYYWMQVYDFMSQYSYYISYIMDLSTPLDQQQCAMVEEEMTWQQYFVEEALYTWNRYQALYDEANAAGYKLPDEFQQGLDKMEESMKTSATQNGYASLEEMMTGEFGAGVTFDDYMYYLERYYVGNLYFSDLMEKVEVTDKELEAYFKENETTLAKNDITKDSGLLLDIRQILVKPTATKDEDGNSIYTSDAWKNCESKAQEILNLWLKGEKTEDSFAELATSKSEDKNTASSGGLVQYVSKLSLTTVDVRHILIKADGTENADGTITFKDQEAANEAKAKAQDILNKWLENPTEEYFIQLANKNSEDKNGKVTDGGIYENVKEGQMVTNFNDWCFDASRKEGNCEIVETEFGYHIMYFVHRDDAIEQWAFGDRKEGDTTLVKTDDGYVVLYYVSGEDGWIVYSRNGVLQEKSAELLKNLTEEKTPEVSYGKIALGAVSLNSGTSSKS